MTLAEIDKYVSDIVEDIVADIPEGDDRSADDLAEELDNQVYENADGSEFVIYPAKAERFVAALPDDERDDAYDEARSLVDPDQDSYSQLHTVMAFLRLRDRIGSALRDELNGRFA